MDTRFAPDNHATPDDRNWQLSQLLRADWSQDNITKIVRTPHPDHPEYTVAGWLAFIKTA